MKSNISGVYIESIDKYEDNRGILIELFREDKDISHTKMGYISYTNPKVGRGPHEHLYQEDCFVFIDGSFELYLWDARIKNTLDIHASREIFLVGENNKVKVYIPPGIIHGYKNIGDKPAFVLNFPDKLYKGWNKSEAVDEIRHEGNSLYRLERT